jgi:glycosyltransferase involved in cell wall biosynthesis
MVNKTNTKFNSLSIIIPMYNEYLTIENVLENISGVNLIDNIEKEIVVVDDFSTDSSKDIVLKFIANHPNLKIKLFSHPFNQGKGSSIRTGIKLCTGDLIIVQDADLEYNPQEYNILLRPIIEGFADVVYGSRFIGGNAHRVLFFWHSIGNKMLTFLSNVFTNLNITDMETCYKIFKSHIIKSLNLSENRFGFEPEVTAKISRIPKIRIYEVGISYYGRSYAEGKKINWKDGIRAIYCIVKYGFLKNK